MAFYTAVSLILGSFQASFQAFGMRPAFIKQSVPHCHCQPYFVCSPPGERLKPTTPTQPVAKAQLGQALQQGDIAPATHTAHQV